MQTIIEHLSELSDKELEAIILDIDTCEKQGLISENVRKMCELQRNESKMGTIMDYHILVQLFIYKEAAKRWVLYRYGY